MLESPDVYEGKVAGKGQVELSRRCGHALDEVLVREASVDGGHVAAEEEIGRIAPGVIIDPARMEER